MTIRAVYFDLGGVLLRTEDKGPRARLGAEFGMSYDEIDRFVFECETAKLASIGKMSEDAHWLDVTRRLGQPESDMPRIRDAFFDGDVLDRSLVDLLRNLRKTHRTGLISNAWDGLRPWILREKFDDAFDHMTISAEVGAAKPDARIYRFALEQLGAAPGETLFVDDVQKNIDGCEAVGMRGILFRSAGQVMREIETFLKE